MKKWFLLFLMAAAASLHAEPEKVLVYGKIVSAKNGDFLVQCERASCKLPIYRGVIVDSSDELVHVAISPEARARIMSDGSNPEWHTMGKLLQDIDRRSADPKKEHRKRFAENPILWSEGDHVAMLGQQDGTFSYLNILNKRLTVPNVGRLEALPIYSIVEPQGKRDERLAAATTPTPPNVTIVPAQSKSPNEMELPRYNLDTTLEDLKPGITAEKARRILGSPLYINGTQWVYRNGYVYVENGVVVSLQNRAGEVFASSYGK